ncbi:MAG: glycosyltransferase [Phormidesmis sp.]
MNLSNSVIQGLWVGSALSSMEHLSIKSFLKHGHEYHLYTYNAVDNIPQGTILKDANEILAKDKIFTLKHGWGQGSYAAFSDLFRYQLLHIKGGWWADTDVICVKPFDLNARYVIASSFEGAWGSPANNCVMKMPAQSKLSHHLVNTVAQYHQNRQANLTFTSLGPQLLQKAVADLNLSKHVVSCYHFCPISWRSVESQIAYYEAASSLSRQYTKAKTLLRLILKPWIQSDRITTNTYAIHLWNEIWRSKQLDKSAQYHPSCLYEQLKAKYRTG